MDVKTESAVATATRVVTVLTTRGEKVKISFEGTKWAELKKVLSKGGKDINGKSFSGYELGGMKCVESAAKHTLEHDEAIIPTTDFNLFLMPYKNKSGAKDLSRSECYEKIKRAIEKEPSLKEYYADGTKGFTNVKTERLNELIVAKRPGAKESVSATKAKAISDVVLSVEGNALYNEVSQMSTNDQMYLVIKLLIDINSKISGSTTVTTPVSKGNTTLATAKEEPKAPIETEEEKKIRLQKEADDKETEQLQEEMGGMISGFSDVKH